MFLMPKVFTIEPAERKRKSVILS